MARSELVDALSVAGRALSSRSTLPILSGLLLSAEDSGVLTLQATDLEVSVKVSSACLVEMAGQAVLPGRLITEIVRALPEAAVTLSVEGQTAAVTCGQASFSMKTLSPDDFPKFPEVEIDKTIALPTVVFSEVAAQVVKAISRDETRPILTGVLLIAQGHILRMVATDSYRLAVKEVELDEATAEDIEVVIPGKAVEEVSRMVTAEEKVTIGVSENQVVFSFGETVFVTRRIEGSFPNYRQLIPKDAETKAVVAREELLAAAKRVSLLAQHNSPVRVSVSAEKQTVSLSATTQDVGDASEDIMGKVEGPDVEIAFNHVFLTDGIVLARGEQLQIDTVSPLKPGVLRSVGEEGFLYLLMPVRLG
jgi:DNA polymerase-3 subunit beta